MVVVAIIMVIVTIDATGMREEIFCNSWCILNAAKIGKGSEEIKYYQHFFSKNEVFSAFHLTIAILL